MRLHNLLYSNTVCILSLYLRLHDMRERLGSGAIADSVGRGGEGIFVVSWNTLQYQCEFSPHSCYGQVDRNIMP